MITRGFIEKVHYIFDELNYHETENLNFSNFEKAATNTLTHCKDLDDAREAVKMYQFCLRKWSAIEKIFKKKLSVFNEYTYEGNSLLSLVGDEEAVGTYYITNGINSKVQEIFVASESFDEKIFALGVDNGKIRIFDDGDYYIKYAKLSSVKMKLFNRQNDCLCTLVLSEDLGVFLKNNLTQYVLNVYDGGFVGIYDRPYIDNLLADDIVDTDKCIADIEWDILERKSKLGIAKLNIYADDQDLEMLLLFATSTFLIFQKYVKSEKGNKFFTLAFLNQLRQQ